MTDVTDTPTNFVANPAPLGLLGFGMTTVLLNLHNAGMIPLDAMILSMGIFFGGLAQMIAGIMEFKNRNTFGATAFTSYGMFWMSLVFIKLGVAEGMSPDPATMGAYLVMWGILTLFLFIGTLRLNRALQVVFLTLTVLFFALAAGDFTGMAEITVAAGFIGILCGLSAMYAAFGQVLNEVYRKTVLPLG
ncbi:MAG: acetate uptake transporter [Candidatus Methanomethylophilaceae archaeon]|nr:acetate uptake transporter [Candidatus Methanomethylophilaceae archaeon]